MSTGKRTFSSEAILSISFQTACFTIHLQSKTKWNRQPLKFPHKLYLLIAFYSPHPLSWILSRRLPPFPATPLNLKPQFPSSHFTQVTRSHKSNSYNTCPPPFHSIWHFWKLESLLHTALHCKESFVLLLSSCLCCSVHAFSSRNHFPGLYLKCIPS